jgi:plastocyanin
VNNVIPRTVGGTSTVPSTGCGLRQRLLPAAVVLLAGCGGGSSIPVNLPGTLNNKGTKNLTGNEIVLEQDDFAYRPTFVKGGTPGATITVHLKNAGQNLHNFTIKSQHIDVTVDAGTTKDVTITLPPSGATAFVCRFHLQSNGTQGAFFYKSGDLPG